MALLAKGTWVVIADGEKALICENTGTAQAPKLTLRAKMEQSLAADRDLAADRPGRMPDPGEGQRSAMEATDYHRQAKDRFAAEVGAKVSALVVRASAERLVLVAPPTGLPLLRGALSPAAAAAVIAALPKTLTQQPLAELGSQVAALIDPL